MKNYFAKCKNTGELYRITVVYSDGVLGEYYHHSGSVYDEFLKNGEFEIVESDIDKFSCTYIQTIYLRHLCRFITGDNWFSLTTEEYQTIYNKLHEKLKGTDIFENLKGDNKYISHEELDKFIKESEIDLDI